MLDTKFVTRRRALHASRGAMALALLFSVAPSAFAQTEAAGDEAPEAVETMEATSPRTDIVATGSRVVRDGMNAPTPVTVATVEELQAASPGTLSEALNELPQFANSGRPQNAGLGLESGAASTLNLRSPTG